MSIRLHSATDNVFFHTTVVVWLTCPRGLQVSTDSDLHPLHPRNHDWLFDEFNSYHNLQRICVMPELFNSRYYNRENKSEKDRKQKKRQQKKKAQKPNARESMRTRTAPKFHQ